MSKQKDGVYIAGIGVVIVGDDTLDTGWRIVAGNIMPDHHPSVARQICLQPRQFIGEAHDGIARHDQEQRAAILGERRVYARIDVTITRVPQRARFHNLVLVGPPNRDGGIGIIGNRAI